MKKSLLSLLTTFGLLTGVYTGEEIEPPVQILHDDYTINARNNQNNILKRKYQKVKNINRLYVL